MKKVLVTALSMLLLLSFAAVVVAEEAKPAAPAAAPEAAPAPPPPPPKANQAGIEVQPWTAKVLGSGQTVTSESLKGKNYAIVFVNSSCAACRQELSELATFQFGDKLTLYIASVDFNPERSISVYTESLGLKFPILDDSTQALSNSFDFSFTPASVIVGADGKVSAWFGGYSNKHKEKILGEFRKYVK